MAEQDTRLARVCPPDCPEHKGYFRIMLVPPVMHAKDLGKIETMDLTPEQAVDAFDQIMQHETAIKGMILLMEKMLEVKI